jgi:hypothetical protein
MAILWRQLFDALNIRWIDRGHNIGKGHVNIRCPWCGPSDPSYHLGINEADGAYYCLRSHPPHHGRSPYRLLGQGLKVEPYQIDALLRSYSDDSPPARTERHIDTTEWDRFESATEHPVAVDYLASRCIDPPRLVARRYDLRYGGNSGLHSWRILLPLHLNGAIIGWTGRAIRDQEPRYRANDPSYGASLYIPAFPTEATHTIVIVEGPFDAIAITDAYYSTGEIIAIAIEGLNVSPRRLLHLADVIGLVEKPRVLLMLDADQDRNTVENFKKLLVRGSTIPHPESFLLPPGFKDAGEMSRDEIRAWFNQLPNQ